MAQPVMTLGGKWVDHFLAGFTWFNTLTGLRDAPARPKAGSTPDVLVQALQAVANGTFKTSDYFEVGGAPEPSLVSQPPPLTPGADYWLIRLNAETERGRLASTVTGGLVFEEPIWPLLAAHSVSRHDKVLLATPMAADTQDLWNRLNLVRRFVEKRGYRPNDFLGSILGWIQPATAPLFELISVSARPAEGPSLPGEGSGRRRETTAQVL